MFKNDSVLYRRLKDWGNTVKWTSDKTFRSVRTEGVTISNEKVGNCLSRERERRQNLKRGRKRRDEAGGFLLD